jgi:hypothetical protein
MTIDEILKLSPEEAVKVLKVKSVSVPLWEDLKKEYYPLEHPVMDKTLYEDVVLPGGGVEKVSRIALGFQKLSANRMSQLCFGIPVKRIYKAKSNGEKEVARIIETIFEKNRIDAINRDRGKMIFGECEFFTLWYSVENKNSVYGIESPIKVRCKNYSPKKGDGLYPLFDQYDDMVAMCFSSKRKEGDKEVEYFDVYTDMKHIQYVKNGSWVEAINEAISIEKIPGVYLHRESPIWEDNSQMVYEGEMALSRNGNYLRRNAKPVFAVFADEEIEGKNEEKDNGSRDVLQYPKGSEAKYIVWDQAIDNLKYFVSELRQQFFAQIQIPDFSFESMKTTPMSGEARKMLFIDAQLKVTDESGPLLEMLDREINVVRAFVKKMVPAAMQKDVDSLDIETIITPYNISDEKETIQNYSTALGGKAFASLRQVVEALGWSKDVDKTLADINSDNTADLMEPTV